MMKKDNGMISRRNILLGTALGGTFLLTGCPAIFVGGVAVGAAVAFDRRSSGAQLDDKTISVKALGDIGAELPDASVGVSCYNRRVLLTGAVANAEQKARAQTIAGNVANVKEVINALEIGFNADVKTVSNDSYITGKVKTAITTTKGVSSADIKVVTAFSVVYLMGIVTAKEAAIASKVASTVKGVKQVVQVFEIISEDDVKKIQEDIQEVYIPDPQKVPSAG